MLLRITGLLLAAGAAAMKPPSPALRVTALAAVATATAPSFLTSKELRPAARRTHGERRSAFDPGYFFGLGI